MLYIQMIGFLPMLTASDVDDHDDCLKDVGDSCSAHPVEELGTVEAEW